MTIPGRLAPIKEHLCANCLGAGLCLGPRGTPKQVGASQTDFLETRENPRPDRDSWERQHLKALSSSAPGFSRCVHRLLGGVGGAVSASGPVTAPRLGVGVSASFTPVAFPPLPVGCSTPSPPEDVVSPGCSQAGLPIRGPAPCRSRGGGLQRLMLAHAPGAGFLVCTACTGSSPYRQFWEHPTPSPSPNPFLQSSARAASLLPATKITNSRARGQLRDHLIQRFYPIAEQIEAQESIGHNGGRH